MKLFVSILAGLFIISAFVGVYFFAQKNNEVKILSEKVKNFENDSLVGLQKGVDEKTVPRFIAARDAHAGYTPADSLICVTGELVFTCFLSRETGKLEETSSTTLFTVDNKSPFAGIFDGVGFNGARYALSVVSPHYFVLRETSADQAEKAYVVVSGVGKGTEVTVHGKYDAIVGYDAGGSLVLAKAAKGTTIVLSKLDGVGNIATSTSIVLPKKLADEGYSLGVDCSLMKNTPVCLVQQLFASTESGFNDEKGGSLQVYVHNTKKSIGSSLIELDYSSFYSDK